MWIIYFKRQEREFYDEKLTDSIYPLRSGTNVSLRIFVPNIIGENSWWNEVMNIENLVGDVILFDILVLICDIGASSLILAGFQVYRSLNRPDLQLVPHPPQAFQKTRKFNTELSTTKLNVGCERDNHLTGMCSVNLDSRWPYLFLFPQRFDGKKIEIEKISLGHIIHFNHQK